MTRSNLPDDFRLASNRLMERRTDDESPNMDEAEICCALVAYDFIVQAPFFA